MVHSGLDDIRSKHVNDMTVPDQVCDVDGCEELAAIAPRGAAADDLVDADAAEVVPLCGFHAARAQAGRSPN